MAIYEKRLIIHSDRELNMPVKIHNILKSYDGTVTKYEQKREIVGSNAVAESFLKLKVGGCTNTYG